MPSRSATRAIWQAMPAGSLLAIPQFGKDDGPHLFIDRGQLPACGGTPDHRGRIRGQQPGDDGGGAAHRQQRAVRLIEPVLPRADGGVDDDSGQRLELRAEDRGEGGRTVVLHDLGRIAAGERH